MKKVLLPIYDYARAHGFQIRRTRNGHLRLSKRGCPVVFAPSTPSDHRSVQNVLAKLRRADTQAQKTTGGNSCH